MPRTFNKTLLGTTSTGERLVPNRSTSLCQNPEKDQYKETGIYWLPQYNKHNLDNVNRCLRLKHRQSGETKVGKECQTHQLCII